MNLSNHNGDMREICQLQQSNQQEVQTCSDSNKVQNSPAFGGLAFDYGKFPKIIAVHSISKSKKAQNFDKSPPPLKHFERATDGEISQNYMPRMPPTLCRPQVMTKEMHAMPANMHAMPTNMPIIPNNVANYQRMLPGYLPETRSCLQEPAWFKFPYFYQSFPSQQHFYPHSNFAPRNATIASQSPHNISANNLETNGTSYSKNNTTRPPIDMPHLLPISMNEPPKLLPISGNLYSATDHQLKERVAQNSPYTDSNEDLISQDSPASNESPYTRAQCIADTLMMESLAKDSPCYRQPSFANTPLPPPYTPHPMDMRHPPHGAYNTAWLQHPESAPPPYIQEQVKSGMSYRADESLEVIQQPYRNDSAPGNQKSRSNQPATFCKELRAKPYERPSSVDSYYSSFLKLENKGELLGLLNEKASQGRMELIDVIDKLLRSDFIENSLSLLENLKLSNLTEKIKERILSVVEEIIWQAPPKENLWKNQNCSPDKDNFSCNDVEFERQQQAYLDELKAAYLMHSDAINIELSEDGSGNEKICAITEDREYNESKRDDGVEFDGCDNRNFSSDVELNPSSPLSSVDAENDVDVCSNARECEHELDEIEITSVISVSEKRKSPLDVDGLKRSDEEMLTPTNEGMNDCLQEKTNNYVDNERDSLKENTETKIAESGTTTHCIKKNKIKSKIQDFENNNHIVRNIFDLFT
eukprot:gene11025-12189_t